MEKVRRYLDITTKKDKKEQNEEEENKEDF